MDTKQPIVPSAGFALQAITIRSALAQPGRLCTSHRFAAGSRRTMRDALQTIVDVALATTGQNRCQLQTAAPPTRMAARRMWDAFPGTS